MLCTPSASVHVWALHQPKLMTVIEKCSEDLLIMRYKAKLPTFLGMKDRFHINIHINNATSDLSIHVTTLISKYWRQGTINMIVN